MFSLIMENIFIEMMAIASGNDFTLAKDLFALALADGKMKEEEKQTFMKICADNNISKESFMELFNTQNKSDLSILSATKKEKEDYLVKMIQMMGADGDSATQEIFMLEMIASRLGFSRMRVISLVLLNATHKNFPHDYGAKVLSSFLSNLVDPKGMSDQQNHENIARIYDEIAKATPFSDNPNEDKAILENAFNRVTRMMLEDTLLVNEFHSACLDLQELLEYESQKALRKWLM